MIKKKKIAFFSIQLGERGTEIALYDYAHFNEVLLGNESGIFYLQNAPYNNKLAEDKFHKRFKSVNPLTDFSDIHNILLNDNYDMLYVIGAGDDNGYYTTVCRCVIHCVFGAHTPFGDVYASLMPWSSKSGERPWVPHMINLPDCSTNIKQELSIPKSAIVFGSYGGKGSFNIEYTYESIYKLAKQEKNIYFLFANFDEFCDPLPNIIHIPVIVDLNKKVEFINTCDVMIHAQKLGETFGLAVAEFSTKNKPIISEFTTSNGSNTHVRIIGDKGFWYSSKEEFEKHILYINQNIEEIRNKDWNCYNDYTPEKVMKKWQEVFINE